MRGFVLGVGLLAFCWWAVGTGFLYWIMPAIQRTYWVLLVSGFGDFLAGIIIGMCLFYFAYGWRRHGHTV